MLNKIVNNCYATKCYNEFFFWENKILNDSQLWNGYFDEKSITKNSKIIYTGIINTSKNVFKCGWAVYPNIHTLLGFIQHVFLPTSLFTWFDHESEDFFMPVSPFDIVTEEVKKTSNSSYNIDISNMEKNFYSLNNLWDYDVNFLLKELISFCNTFNSSWDNHGDKKLFIKIFDNPSQVFTFIKNSLMWDFDEFVKEEINMTLDDLKFSCDNAINEPLLNKKLIHILNTNMPIMF